MPKLLKNGQVVADNWRLLVQAETETETELPEGKVLLPMNYWLQNREQLKARNGDIGVWIDSAEEVEALGDQAQELPVIGINFPKFVDGRGFSTARLLRERYSYNGEIRAVGNFIRDQLFYMKRCGINAFKFSNDTDLQAASASLHDFSDAYQGATEIPQPLFRRRA